jgi:hypothetical protein
MDLLDQVLTDDLKKKAVKWLLGQFLKWAAKKAAFFGYGWVVTILTKVVEPLLSAAISWVFRSVKDKKLEAAIDQLKIALAKHDQVTETTTQEEKDAIDKSIKDNLRNLINKHAP